MSIYKQGFVSPRPIARNTDPASSHAGAAKMINSGRLEGQCAQVLEALKRFPMHTAKELSRDSGLDYIMIQKRLSVLEGKGLARRRGERKCTVSKTGIEATQWEAV